MFFFLGANCFGKCLRFWTKNCKKINFDTDLEKLQKFGGVLIPFHMRSPVNKRYILDILRPKPWRKWQVELKTQSVVFFYNSWMIFSRRKKFEFFRNVFRTFWAHRLFFQADFASFGRISLIALRVIKSS